MIFAKREDFLFSVLNKPDPSGKTPTDCCELALIPLGLYYVTSVFVPSVFSGFSSLP